MPRLLRQKNTPLSDQYVERSLQGQVMLAAYYTSFVLLKDRLSQTHVQIITNFALYFAQRPYNA